MGVATGCSCKEVYRFPHTTFPTPLVSVLFCSSIPTFCSFKKKKIPFFYNRFLAVMFTVDYNIKKTLNK